MSAERIESRRSVEVRCAACGDRWAPDTWRSCGCGRSQAGLEGDDVELLGPIEAMWEDDDGLHTAAADRDGTFDGPSLRRLPQAPLL